MDNSAPKITKESKNKIRVEFDRTPLKERLKAKFLNFYFFQTVIIKIFRFIFLLGIAYIVLFPFFTKIAGSFMSPEDFTDVTVRLIPKNFTLELYKAIWVDLHYVKAVITTALISFGMAVIQTLICCVIAYGLAKYKFKGNGLIFIFVMVTMIIPNRTLGAAMKTSFTYFDIAGILSTLSGGPIIDFDFIGMFHFTVNAPFDIKLLNLPYHSVNLTNTVWPFIILSVTGLAFKNGLYIFMLRQFFRGIPDSLEESAYIDGSGDFRTFFQIILPMSVPMMVTVFLFSFCWQWTDTFYTSLFISDNKRDGLMLLSSLSSKLPKSIDFEYAGQALYETAARNTIGIMIIAPLVVLYVFMQRYLVEGIERSGLTAE